MTEADFETKVNKLTADTAQKFTDVGTEIKGLKDEIAALQAGGTGATPEQLDALGVKVDAIDAQVTGFSTT